MEYFKIILAILFSIAFIIGVAVLRINIRSKKTKKNKCSNPDMANKIEKCEDCSLIELCNYKDS